MNTKQVIVMRKDLNMRKGKMIAQGSHASMAFLTKDNSLICDPNQLLVKQFVSNGYHFSKYETEIRHWLENSFKKICVSVNSEQELIDIYNKAKERGLIVHLIEDNGATEFNGVKTKTCLAIGPHLDEDFIGLTDHLPLL